MNRKRRSRRGFTLVEMIVATVLLAIGVVACLGAIGVSTRATGVANDYSTATLLADRRISEIESDPTNNLTAGEQSGDFGADFPGFSWNQNIEQTDITGLLRVTLLIEWTNGASRSSATFNTYEPQPDTSTTNSTTGT